MQLDRRAKRSGSQSQGIPLGSSPSPPFDDHDETKGEELLRKRPLQRLDLLPPFFIVVVKCKSVHPFVGSKTDSEEPAFKHAAKGGLAGTRQSAQDD